MSQQCWEHQGLVWGALQGLTPQEKCPQGVPTLSPGCPQGVPRKSPPLARPVLPKSSPEGHGVTADPPPRAKRGLRLRGGLFTLATKLSSVPTVAPRYRARCSVPHPPPGIPGAGSACRCPPPRVPGDRRLPLSPGPSRAPRSGASRCRGVSPARGGGRASGGGGGGAGAGAGRGERSRPAPRYK